MSHWLRARLSQISHCLQAFPYFYVPYNDDFPQESLQGELRSTPLT